jgi:hypothetical protein
MILEWTYTNRPYNHPNNDEVIASVHTVFEKQR